MTFQLIESDGPVLVSVPHAGTRVPEEVVGSQGPWRDLPDTDWHVDRLVDFAPAMGVSLIAADYARYVVDLNRPANDEPLYERAGTGLVPTETFSGLPLYPAGQEPNAAERQRRIERYWRPYHQAIARRLAEIKARHGHAILFDAHSIISRVPRLFDDQLPDLNLGTYAGQSCAASLQQRVGGVLVGAGGFSHVINGRFQGGYITRHYGQPEQGVHALQLEIAQCCYMDEADPGRWDEDRAMPLKQVLKALVSELLAWQPA
jgi:N-formylglutamate deformylase